MSTDSGSPHVSLPTRGTRSVRLSYILLLQPFIFWWSTSPQQIHAKPFVDQFMLLIFCSSSILSDLVIINTTSKHAEVPRNQCPSFSPFLQRQFAYHTNHTIISNPFDGILTVPPQLSKQILHYLGLLFFFATSSSGFSLVLFGCSTKVPFNLAITSESFLAN